MSHLRNFEARQKAQFLAALKIALEVGLLERCKIHGCIMDAMNDFALEDAYRCGESLMARNHPAVAIFQGNRKRMHHAIDNVRSGMPNCCPRCYHIKMAARNARPAHSPSQP